MRVVDDDDPFELVGDLIDGQFRVDSFVGFGDLSVVYRGFHVGVEANVALKFLDLPTTLDDALVAPLIRSFREGTKLHYRLARGHMHIAQSIGSGQTVAPRTGAVVPYLVREWLEGMSLNHDFSERRARGLTGRSLVEAVDLFRGALEGLAYAHRQGVAHLALNPSNLFLAQSGPEIRLKILDFGVAHAMNEHAGPIRSRKSSPQQPAGLRVLVPAYAAPEQLDAALGSSGTWTDVYAMALLFVEALVDAPMFGDTPPTLDQAVRPTARKITLPANLDPRVSDVLARALMFAPRERQASAGVLWKELSEALPTRTAAIVRRPSTAPKMPALRRSPTLVGLNATPAPFPAPTTRPPPPDLSPGPPPKKSNRPPPVPTRNPAPTTKPPPPIAPSAPIARPITKPLSPNFDDAPTKQELALMQQPLRVSTPLAAPLAAPFHSPIFANMEIPRPPTLPVFSPKKDFTPAAFEPIPSLEQTPYLQPQYAPAPQMGSFSTPLSSRQAETVAPPGMKSSTKKIALVAGVALGAMALLISIIALATSSHSDAKLAQPIPTASAAPLLPAAISTNSAATAVTTTASAITPAPVTTTRPLPTAPILDTTPAPVAARNATATGTPSSSRRPFTLNVGRAALDRASESLADCKLPHGRHGAGQVRVTFGPDSGNVIHVLLGPPYAGSEQGKCIVAKYRAAHIEPFKGRPSAMNYTFMFPR